MLTEIQYKEEVDYIFKSFKGASSFDFVAESIRDDYGLVNNEDQSENVPGYPKVGVWNKRKPPVALVFFYLNCFKIQFPQLLSIVSLTGIGL
mgnify:CR=1 FL=1